MSLADQFRTHDVENQSTPLAPYDAYAADEAFLTSTSLCLCPVRSINGVRIGGEDVFGAVTRRLIQGYTALVGTDFVGQYRRHL